MSTNSYVGCKISLISKSEIRYEGILQAINSNEATVTLENVRSFGSEGRRGGINEIPASPQVYELIVFKGTDIRDLQVCEAPPQPPSMPSYFGSAGQQQFVPRDEYFATPGSFYAPHQMYSNMPPPYYNTHNHMAAAPSLVRNPSYVPAPSSFINNPSEFDSMWTPDSLSSPSAGTFRQSDLPPSSLAQSHHFSGSSLSSEMSLSSFGQSSEAPRQEKSVNFGFVKPKEQPSEKKVFPNHQSQTNKIASQQNEEYLQRSQKENSYNPHNSRQKYKQSRNNEEFDFEHSNSLFVKEESAEDIPKEQYYKKGSFFDNISCDSTKDHGSNELGAMDRKQKFKHEMAINRQTFGVSAPPSNNFKYHGRRNFNPSSRNGGGEKDVNRRQNFSGSFVNSRNKDRSTALPSSAEINDFQNGL